MATKKIDPTIARPALARVLTYLADPQVSERPERAAWATAVRFLLAELTDRAPGRAVEVRIPPYGATQILTGTTHRRGTPPAVVEMNAETFLSLAAGRLSWDRACHSGLIEASGERTDLSQLFPMTPSGTPNSTNR